MKVHPSHKTRSSDASSYDEICTLCDATDGCFGGNALALPCPKVQSLYDEAYFLHGKESGKSLYTDYRWLEHATVPMVCRMISYLNIDYRHTILDFGCARGYVVKAFRQLGYEAYGVDISEWAVRNADEETKPYLNWIENSPPLLAREFDWVIAKDVLEHVQLAGATVERIMDTARVGVLAVVPLSEHDGSPYVIEDYEKDVTHIHRWALDTWAGLFMRPGWAVTASYRLPGVKDNWYKPGWEKANGFLTARRV